MGARPDWPTRSTVTRFSLPQVGFWGQAEVARQLKPAGSVENDPRVNQPSESKCIGRCIVVIFNARLC
jgi:hypothetical protein